MHIWPRSSERRGRGYGGVCANYCAGGDSVDYVTDGVKTGIADVFTRIVAGFTAGA